MGRKRTPSAYRGQSAIEYLMSYAWMFVIIVIVIIALFSLSAYSPVNVPKAIPGSCQVSRPGGPYTTTLISLEGVCNNLLPKFVTQMSQSANSYILIPLVDVSNTFTLTFWAYPNDTGSSPQNLVYANGISGGSAFGSGWSNDNPPVPVAWQFFTIVVNTGLTSNQITLYINGTYQGAKTQASASVNSVDIGGPIPSATPTPLYAFQGQISNVQVYTTAFTVNQVDPLYYEGLGGTPIDLKDLLAWWPLNGNSNDYSGNNRNAQGQGGLDFSGILTQAYVIP